VEDETWDIHTCGGGGMEHKHMWGRYGTYTRVREETWNIITCGVGGMEHKHVMDKIFSIAT
jgi:hypothetical protein